MKINILVLTASLFFILASATTSTAQSDQTAELAAVSNVVDITAIDYAFRAPDVISSGWTTIRFKNDGEEAHFIYLSRLPEGKTSDDYETDLSDKFSDIWYALRDGEIDQEQAFTRLGEQLPEWFPSLQVAGGPGLMAPGLSSEITLNLEPGTYVLECYMKTEDGEIHYMDGMLRPLVVTGEPPTFTAPIADLRITLSNFEMVIEGEMKPGRRTVEVHVAENPEEGFGHSVHMAQLNDGTDVEQVVNWMNWFNLQGLRTPAPATFIGGSHPMAPGSTAYFTVDVEPGRYLLLSEATASQGVMQEITVAP